MPYRTIYKEVEIDVDMSDFDDDEIRDEYEDRFGVPTDDEEGWMDIYELRRAGKMEEFLRRVDVMIMNRTGRVL